MTQVPKPMTEAERIERASAAVYREFENRPQYARLQMNGVMAEELARAAITAYLGGDAQSDDLRKFVVDHWDNQDMNHEDFRVQAYQIALGDDPPVETPPQVGLNWELSDETRKHLDEIERAIVRPGDPRLNQIICGSPTPEPRG